MTEATVLSPQGQGTGAATVIDPLPFYKDQQRVRMTMQRSEAAALAAQKKAEQKRIDDFAKGWKLETNPSTFGSQLQSEIDNEANNAIFGVIREFQASPQGTNPYVVSNLVQQKNNNSIASKTYLDEVGKRIVDINKELNDIGWNVGVGTMGEFESFTVEEGRQKVKEIANPIDKFNAIIAQQNLPQKYVDFATRNLDNYNFGLKGSKLLDKAGETGTKIEKGGKVIELKADDIINVDVTNPNAPVKTINLEKAEELIFTDSYEKAIYARSVKELMQTGKTNLQAREASVKRYFGGKGDATYQIDIVESGDGSKKEKAYSTAGLTDQEYTTTTNETFGSKVIPLIVRRESENPYKNIKLSKGTAVAGLNQYLEKAILEGDTEIATSELGAFPVANKVLQVDGKTYDEGTVIPPEVAKKLSRKTYTIKPGFAMTLVSPADNASTAITYEFGKGGRPKGRSEAERVSETSSKFVDELGKVFLPINKAPAQLTQIYKKELGKSFDNQLKRLVGQYNIAPVPASAAKFAATQAPKTGQTTEQKFKIDIRRNARR